YKRGHGEIRHDTVSASDDTSWDQTRLVVEEGLFRVGHLAEETSFGLVPATYLEDAIRLNGRGTTRSAGGAAIGVTSGVVVATGLPEHNAVTTTPATRGIYVEANGGTFVTSLGGNSWVVESIIKGPGGVNINGNGFPVTAAQTPNNYETQSSILVFKGANSYGGATNINIATLVAQGGAAIPDTSAVVIDPAATQLANLRIDANETIGSLAGGNASFGKVLLNGGDLTTGGDNSSTTFSGVIQNS